MRNRDNKKKKPKEGGRGDALREQSERWSEASICQRNRGGGKRAERQTEKKRERRRRGGADKLKTACGCTDTGCETDQQKGGRSWGGLYDGATRQDEGVKDRQPERVTECGPERESVWVSVRAARANSSVNPNL